MHYAMALHPTGKQVAFCLRKIKTVSVRDGDGPRAAQARPIAASTAHLLAGRLAAVVFGKEARCTTRRRARSCTVPDSKKRPLPRGRRPDGQVSCHHWPWRRACATWPAARSFTRSMPRNGMLRRDLRRLGRDGVLDVSQKEVVLCDATDGWKELRRFPVRTGAGRWSFRRARASGCWVAHGETATSPSWTRRPARSPRGASASVRWRCRRKRPSGPGSLGAGPAVQGTRRGQAAAAAGRRQQRVHIIDLTAFIRAFEQDGNFSLEQLNRLSNNAPKAIAAFLEQWPHAINHRDPKTKDTVLHHCARTSNPDATKQWLSGSVAFAPLENSKGRTALCEAIEEQQQDTAKQMFRLLDPQLPLNWTDYLTRDLVAIANKWQRSSSTSSRFWRRGPFSASSVRSVPAGSGQQLDDYDVRASTNGAGDMGRVRGGRDEVKCDSTLQVIALRNFACAPTKESHCRPTRSCSGMRGGFETQLSALLDTSSCDDHSFKWHTYVRSRVLNRLYKYMVHFILAGVTMVSAPTRRQPTPSSTRTADGEASGRS